MKRSSVEPWIENIEETGCLEPAFKQNTNDDDDLWYYFLENYNRYLRICMHAVRIVNDPFEELNKVLKDNFTQKHP